MKMRQTSIENRMSDLTKAKIQRGLCILALVLMAAATIYGIYMGRSLIGLIAGWAFSLLGLLNTCEKVSKEKRYAVNAARYEEEHIARQKEIKAMLWS